MQTETLNMFAGVVNEIANGPKVTDFQSLTASLMRRLSEKGLTLEQCADRRMLNRSRSTLEGHCREYSIRFPDYVPANMRKHVKFVQRGEFLELTGDLVTEVAAVLEAVVTKRDDVPSCAVPVHGYEDAKAKLKAAWYEVSKSKAPRKPKAAANG